MSTFPNKGILVALALPFDQEGKLMRSSLEKHINWLIEQGINGILVNGSSAQFPLLTVNERKDAMAAVSELAGSLPVIANISDVDPRVACELGRFAASNGNCGVAIMPPAFYQSKAVDQLAWFTHVSEAADLPVLLYNFPERTGNRIDPETIREFARRAPVSGIKQSGTEFAYHEELIQMGNELGFSVFSGADTRLPEVFKMGAAGCIGGLVNFSADLMVAQYRMLVLGEPGELEPTASRMKKIGEVINRESFPANISAGLLARGLEPGVGHVIISRETERNLQVITKDLRALFDEWNLSPVRDKTVLVS